MLDEDEPRFANWDQDETAIASDYAEQDPAEVDVDLVEAAGHVAGLYATVTPETATGAASAPTAASSPSRPSGSTTCTTWSTTSTTSAHEHVHDTVRAYDLDAAAYAATVRPCPTRCGTTSRTSPVASARAPWCSRSAAAAGAMRG